MDTLRRRPDLAGLCTNSKGLNSMLAAINEMQIKQAKTSAPPHGINLPRSIDALETTRPVPSQMYSRQLCNGGRGVNDARDVLTTPQKENKMIEGSRCSAAFYMKN